MFSSLPTLLRKALRDLPVFLLISLLAACSSSSNSERSPAERPAAPVRIDEIQRGTIEYLRTFGGTLEADSEFILSSKVSGRLEKLDYEIGDIIRRGDIVAKLDDDEYEQASIQAEAELLVTKANLAEAESKLEIAKRETERTRTLVARGVASDAEFDAAQSRLLAAEASVEVFKAQLIRAEATVESAKIRRSYAQIAAIWPEGDTERIVAERFLDPGQTIGANEPLLRIISIDSLKGVFYITEKEYAHLSNRQKVELETDAYPGERFVGEISRLSPVFEKASRQARVELAIPNRDRRLKPGMFVRATIQLEKIENALIVPEIALINRDDRTGIFLVDRNESTAHWQPIEVGIRQDRYIQIVSPNDLHGSVITLGQQLVDDGSPVAIFDNETDTPNR